MLSILDEHPDGLTGYAIVKEIKTKFGPVRRISPGTIYPKLERLRDKGRIVEEGNIYKITAKGKDRLSKKIPETIQNYLEFIPQFYKLLMRPLPFRHRMDFLSEMGISMCSTDAKSHLNIFDDIMPPDNLQTKAGLMKSIKRLQVYRQRLLQLKIKVKERRNTELQAIDEKISAIDEKIKDFQKEKESWTEINVEDHDISERG